MRLFIEPLDVLFFRDGKPFAAGEAHMAQSLFPPTALTFQGAIRTAILAASGIDVQRYQTVQDGAEDTDALALVAEIGGAATFGRLRLRGPFVATMPTDSAQTASAEAWYPCPADVVTSRKARAGLLTRLRPFEEPAWTSDLPLEMSSPWAFGRAWVETARGFLSQPDLEHYLAGEVPTAVWPENTFVVREPRLGIALAGRRKVADEGKLYTIEMLRLRADDGRRVGFILDVEGTARLPRKGLLALGGERRAATYECIEERLFPTSSGVVEAIQRSRRFLLYLATPAIFESEPRWLPDFIEADSLSGTWQGITIKIISVAAGRPMPIGGWDLARGHPKAMLPAVPAGSVYWCEVVSGTGEAVVQGFHGQCLSSRLAEIGFGLTFVGRWPHV